MYTDYIHFSPTFYITVHRWAKMYIICVHNIYILAQPFTSQYIVALRNIVYAYHQTVKPNRGVTAPVSRHLP